MMIIIFFSFQNAESQLGFFFFFGLNSCLTFLLLFFFPWGGRSGVARRMRTVRCVCVCVCCVYVWVQEGVTVFAVCNMEWNADIAHA